MNWQFEERYPELIQKGGGLNGSQSDCRPAKSLNLDRAAVNFIAGHRREPRMSTVVACFEII